MRGSKLNLNVIRITEGQYINRQSWHEILDLPVGDTFCIEKAGCLLKIVLAGNAEAEMVQAEAVFI